MAFRYMDKVLVNQVTGWNGVLVGWQPLEEQKGVLLLHTEDTLL